MSFVRRGWRAYTTVLEKRPLLVQMATTGTIVWTGDAIAQLAIERKGRQFDEIRSLRFATFGLFVLGPALRGWYTLLDRTYKGTGTRIVLQKLFTDQVIFPPSTLAAFICYMSYFKGETTSQTKRRLRRFWPFVQFLNFFFAPLQYRFLVVNCGILAGITYLAWRTERDGPFKPF